jgi:putative tryptophan/tyrosine transport system substrate-binding protein
VRRRNFITLLGSAAVAGPLAARAQQKAMPVIGFLNASSVGRDYTALVESIRAFRQGFRQGLSDAGYVEGQNVAFEYRWAEGHYDRLPALAADLVARKVDLIFVVGDPAIRAAQQATTTVPIVGMTDDMLGSGLVASMARPGGNTTGISIFATELDVKRLELLHEAVPQASRIGVLADRRTVSPLALLEAAARRLGIDLVILSVENPDEVGRVADQLTNTGAKAVNVLASPLLNAARAAIIERLNRAGLPAIYQWPETAEEGGLLGYGPRFVACAHQVAALAVKILKGEKPAELPVEQPTKFDLVINLKTAKALGLTVPHVLLAQADEVIE